MPVVTRSQLKKNLPQHSQLYVWEEQDRKAFVQQMLNYIYDFKLENNIEAKIRKLITMYNIIDLHLEKIAQQNTPKWLNFANVVYNKAIEFDKQLDTLVQHVDYQLVFQLQKSYSKSKKFFAHYLASNDNFYL